MVREAHNYMRDCTANGVAVDNKVTTEILSKGWEDNMEALRVHADVLSRYPRPLSNLEKKKMKTTVEREELNDYAQKMYGGDDSDEDI